MILLDTVSDPGRMAV